MNLQFEELISYNEIIDYNSKKNLFAFSCNNKIVLFDYTRNKKVIISFHKAEIKSLKFSLCGNFLFSIDKCYLPVLAYWKIIQDKSILLNDNEIDFNIDNATYNIKLIDHVELQIIKPHENEVNYKIPQYKNTLNPEQLEKHFLNETENNSNRLSQITKAFINQITKDLFFLFTDTEAEIQYGFIFEIAYDNQINLLHQNKFNNHSTFNGFSLQEALLTKPYLNDDDSNVKIRNTNINDNIIDYYKLNSSNYNNDNNIINNFNSNISNKLKSLAINSDKVNNNKQSLNNKTRIRNNKNKNSSVKADSMFCDTTSYIIKKKDNDYNNNQNINNTQRPLKKELYNKSLTGIFFYTTDESHLFVWKIISINHIKLISQITIKDKVQTDSLCFSSIKKLIFLLSKKGNLMIFDEIGNFLISFSAKPDIILHNDINNNSSNLKHRKITAYSIVGDKVLYSSSVGSITLASLNNFNELYIEDHLFDLSIDKIYFNEEKNMAMFKFSNNNFIRILNIDKVFTKYDSKYCVSENDVYYVSFADNSEITDVLFLNNRFFLSCGLKLILWEIIPPFKSNFENDGNNETNNKRYQINEQQPTYKIHDFYDFKDCYPSKITQANTGNILVGDSLGNIHVFEIDISYEPSIHFSTRLSCGNSKITSLCTFKNKIIIGVENGSITMTEFNENIDDFSFCLTIQECFLSFKEIQHKAFSLKSSFFSFFYILKSSITKLPNGGTVFKAIVYGPCSNTVQIKVVEEQFESKLIKRYNSIQIKEFNFDNEIIQCLIHVSDLYLIVSLLSNTIMIINLESFVVCGVIEFNNPIKNICMDNTGLYMCLYQYNTKENTYFISIYEFGTGLKTKSLDNVGELSTIKLSNYKIIGFYNTGGLFSIDLNEEIKENIFRIEEELKVDPSFWCHFPVQFKEKSEEGFTGFVVEDESDQLIWEQQRIKKKVNNRIIKTEREQPNSINTRYAIDNSSYRNNDKSQDINKNFNINLKKSIFNKSGLDKNKESEYEQRKVNEYIEYYDTKKENQDQRIKKTDINNEKANPNKYNININANQSNLSKSILKNQNSNYINNQIPDLSKHHNTIDPLNNKEEGVRSKLYKINNYEMKETQEDQKRLMNIENAINVLNSKTENNIKHCNIEKNYDMNKLNRVADYNTGYIRNQQDLNIIDNKNRMNYNNERYAVDDVDYSFSDKFNEMKINNVDVDENNMKNRIYYNDPDDIDEINTNIRFDDLIKKKQHNILK